MCFSTCAVTNGGTPFSLTTAVVPANSAVGTIDPATGLAVCLYDFLLIAGGTDPATGLAADRFCGSQFNPDPAGAAASVPVCSKLIITLIIQILGEYDLTIVISSQYRSNQTV